MWIYNAKELDPFIMLGGAQLEEELKRYSINVIFLEDAGHGINLEKADEVNRLIIEYFSGQIGNLRV